MTYGLVFFTDKIFETIVCLPLLHIMKKQIWVLLILACVKGENCGISKKSMINDIAPHIRLNVLFHVECAECMDRLN